MGGYQHHLPGFEVGDDRRFPVGDEAAHHVGEALGQGWIGEVRVPGVGVGILPRGIEKISKLPDLTKELRNRGYSERDVKKILGGNFKRVFKEVTS